MQTELFKQTHVDRIKELEKKVTALEQLTHMLKILINLDRNGVKINIDPKYVHEVQSEFWT